MDAMKIANSIPMWILWNPGNTRYRTGLDFCKKILFGRKEDRTYRKTDEECDQEQRDHFHRTIYRNLKWNAFPSDHCWRTDGVDETFPDRFRYVRINRSRFWYCISRSTAWSRYTYTTCT